ncbi:hypothetical protein CR513_40925, partial [Mucuna pruriens]
MENIFHYRFHVKGKLCSIILMVASKEVESPYLSAPETLQTCVIGFYLGKYNDEILCDVIPMKYDRKVIHDGLPIGFLLYIRSKI